MDGCVLIVEEASEGVQPLRHALHDLGFATEWTRSGDDAVRRVRHHDYALVVLDLLLPDADGFEVCRQIRAGDRYVPLFAVTARTQEIDVVLGLELGADDVIAKPVRTRVFTARVRALFRRIDVDTETAARRAVRRDLVFGELVIRPSIRRVTLCGRDVPLTAREYDVLAFLASHAGRVFGRQALLSRVWGKAAAGSDHVVTSLVHRLRAKIEDDPASPRFLKTVRGAGYCFTTEAELDV